MEQRLSKPLPYKHISQPTEEIIQYIQDRRTGHRKSLQTKWPKLNNRMNGGIEPNVLITVAGISGSGKSSFVNQLENDIIDLNTDQDVVILNLTFEMLGSRNVGRKISQKLKRTTQELYSGLYNTKLAEPDFKLAAEVANQIKQYPIYYVDTPGTVDQIKQTIIQFQQEHKDKWVIIILDHTLLVRGLSNESERQVLVELQRLFINVKKYYKNTIIQVTQMNRGIEEKERILNPSLHFPQRSDLSSSDAIYQASDYVLVIHRPEILGIESYSLRNLPVKEMVYLHILKARDGEPAILQFKNNLKYNSIEDVDAGVKQQKLNL